MLLSKLGARLIGNMLSGKGINRAGVTRITRAGNESQFKKNLLISSYPLTNFEIQQYYQNKPRFNGVIIEIIYVIK